MLAVICMKSKIASFILPLTRKLVSFIFPLTRKIKSEYSGYLELTTFNGRTLLNTKNTNYSYGALQRVLKFGLLNTDLSETRSILVLGLGGGCVVKTLRNKFKYTNRITAVDIDPVIIEIAEKEFGIFEDDKTKIICDDAFDYVMNDNSMFDLILIDLFIDNKIPDKFLSMEFWRGIINKLNPGGTIIFNTLCDPCVETKGIENKLMKRGLKYRIHRHVEGTNRMLIANYC